MDYTIIARPLIGAVIGYSTNWLAIKMLFRPYEEKRIGKIKLPFTPGVIPRERGRIAASLGHAVGKELLTEEVILKELLNDTVTHRIKAYVVGELLSEAFSLEDVMTAVLGEETPEVLAQVSEAIAESLEAHLKSPAVIEAIRQEIGALIFETVPYEGALGALIPEGIVEEVDDALWQNIEGINAYLLTLLKGNGVKGRLTTAIETLVTEKVGAFGAMFLDGPAMADSAIAHIEGLLEEEEVRRGIIEAIGAGVSSLRQKRLSETVRLGFYTETVDKMTLEVTTRGLAYGNKVQLLTVIKPMVDELARKKITLTKSQKDKVEAQVEGLYRAFITKNISAFMTSFDVAKVVEDEINDFSVMDIEKLIFGIIHKELQTITQLGGLLGFLIGLVYVIL